MIVTVPYLYPGAGRRVYPGFLQLAGFMAMNFGNHLVSHWGMFRHLVEGDDEGADATKDFYDEYRAVCDMTAEFYLQTIDGVFQRYALPRGDDASRPAGRSGAITDVPILGSKAADESQARPARRVTLDRAAAAQKSISFQAPATTAFQRRNGGPDSTSGRGWIAA